MAPPPGRLGNVCVWIVSALLLLSVLSGGAILVFYMTIPDSEATIWLPVAGMVLVGIPWLFWITTCCYRSVTQRDDAFNPAPSKRAAAVSPPAPSDAMATTPIAAHSDSPVDSPGGRRRVHFGAATVLTEADGGQEQPDVEADGRPQTARAPPHDDGSSLGSHESERPLAFSMSS